MRGILPFVLVFLFICHGNVLSAADMDWQESFDRICAITADSDNLTIEQLSDLITESDDVLLKIKASDDPKKKLYLIRLKKCRNFFIFMRDVKRDTK